MTDGHGRYSRLTDAPVYHIRDIKRLYWLELGGANRMTDIRIPSHLPLVFFLRTPLAIPSERKERQQVVTETHRQRRIYPTLRESLIFVQGKMAGVFTIACLNVLCFPVSLDSDINAYGSQRDRVINPECGEYSVTEVAGVPGGSGSSCGYSGVPPSWYFLGSPPRRRAVAETITERLYAARATLAPRAPTMTSQHWGGK